MTKELLQQAHDALITSLAYVDATSAIAEVQGALKAIEQALAQQEQPAQEPCGCREGECGTKEDKTCRMTLEIDGRGGIPEWTPTIGIDCAISSLRDDAIRLRDGSYTPLQIADDLNVIANDLGKCNPVAQKEQPASVDAYVGAREDAAIWKNRALVAEELNRKFIAELNGPTYLGEPAQQEQPAQEPVAWMHKTGSVWNGINRPDERGYWKPLYTHPAPTQPALSETDMLKLYTKASGKHIKVKEDGLRRDIFRVMKAVEAHCRGGANK